MDLESPTTQTHVPDVFPATNVSGTMLRNFLRWTDPFGEYECELVRRPEARCAGHRTDDGWTDGVGEFLVVQPMFAPRGRWCRSNRLWPSGPAPGTCQREQGPVVITR